MKNSEILPALSHNFKHSYLYHYTYKNTLPETHFLPVIYLTFCDLLLQFHFLFQIYPEMLTMLELFLHHEDPLKIMSING